MKIIIALLLAFSGAAFAKPAKVETMSHNSYSGSGDNNIYAKLVPYDDSVGVGLAYEKAHGSAFGFGGNLLVLPEKKSRGVPGLTAIGGNVFLHFPVDVVDFYVSPGLNLMIMQSVEDKTTIGGSLTFGTLAQVSSNFAVGLEFMMYHPWFQKEFYTAGRSHFTNSAITGRFTF
jgi:hypothetical protein